MNATEHVQPSFDDIAENGYTLFDGDKPAPAVAAGQLELNATQQELQEQVMRSEMLRLVHDRPYHQERQRLVALLEEARTNNQHYVIPGDTEQRADDTGTNHERMLTMARAVGHYGLVAAQKHGITPERVGLTEKFYQLSIDAGETATTLDAGGLITTALSLREMKAASENDADIETAEEALALLGDVLQESGHPIPKATDGLAADTGEMALQAIANHTHQAA